MRSMSSVQRCSMAMNLFVVNTDGAGLTRGLIRPAR